MMADGNPGSETLAFTSDPRELSLTVMEKIWGEAGFTENIKHLVWNMISLRSLLDTQVEMLGKLMDILL